MRKQRLRRSVGKRNFAAKASLKSTSALRAEQLENRLLLSVNDLVWNGTSGADQVLFEQIDATTIRVTESLLNGVAVSNVTIYSGIDGRVIASGLGGNDLLDASGLTTTQSTLDGNAGSNALRGGEAADLLIGGINGGEGAQASHTISGGAGDDTIYGNAQVGAEGSRGGNNLILGDAGNDTIYGAYGSVEKSDSNPSNGGEGGQNLIVGGAGSDTIYPSQTGDGAEGGHGSILAAGDTTLGEAELSTVLSEWTSTRTLSEKLDNIAGVGSGPRNNGDNFLQIGVTLFSDHTTDQLYSDTNGAANWLIDTAGVDSANRVKAADVQDDVQVGQAIWINPAGGFWDEAANWQDGYLPGPNDIAVLNAGSNTITFRSGTVTVLGIQNSSPLALTGGELTVTDTVELGANLQMAGGTLRNAIVNAAPGFKVVATTTTAGALDGVTINGDLEVGINGANLKVYHGLTVNGTIRLGLGSAWSQLLFEQSGGPADQSLLGAVDVVFGTSGPNSINNNTGATLTLGAGVLIGGGSGQLQGTVGGGSQTINLGQIALSGSSKQLLVYDKFINRGVVSFADSANLQIMALGPGWANEAGGVIQGNNATISLSSAPIGGVANSTGSQILVNGGTLSIAFYNGTDYYPWHNDGTIQATNAIVYLGGNFTQAGLGAFDRTDSSVRITGIVDGDVTLNATTGDWVLDASAAYGGGTLRGGVVTLLDGTNLGIGGTLSRQKTGTFDSVTFSGDLNVFDYTLKIVGGLQFVPGSVLRLGKPDGTKNGVLNVTGSLTGTGAIVFNPLNSGVSKSGIVGTTVTVGPGISLSGRDATLLASIINQGTITADGGLLTFSGTANSNQGLIQTLAGGSLSFTSLSQNDGTIQLATSSQLTTGGAVTNSSTGVISAAGSNTVTFSGALTNAGTLIAGTGASLAVGALENTGSGVVSATGGNNITVTGALTNSGAIAAAAGGSIGVTGAVNNLAGGSIDLAAGVPLTVGQMFSNAAGASIELELGGSLLSQQARVTATGAATLDGALTVNLVNGFLPPLGQAINSLSFIAGQTGQFATFTSNDAALQAAYGDNAVAVVLPNGNPLIGMAVWTNPSGGTWGNPANWENGKVPTAGDTVDLQASTGTVTYSAGTLSVDAIIGNGSLHVTGGALSTNSLQLPGAVIVAGGSLAVNSDLTTNDTLSLSAGSLSVAGTLQTNAALSLSAGTLSYTTLQVQGPLTINGGTWSYAGDLNLAQTLTMTGGSLTVEGAVTLSGAPSTLTMTGGALTVDGSLTVAGAVSLAGSSSSLDVTDDMHAQSTLSLTGGSLSVDGSLTVAGAVSLAGSSSVLDVTNDMHAQSTLSWAGGNFSVDGNLTIDGAAVGMSGTLSVGGNLVALETLTVGRTATTISNWPFGGTTVSITPSNLYVAGNLEMHNTLIFNGGALHNATLVMLDGAQLSVPVMRHTNVSIVGTTSVIQDTSGTLDNVTIDSDVDFSGSSAYSSGGTGISYFFSYLTVTGGLTLNADLTLGGTSYGRLQFTGSPAQTLTGTGSVTFGPYRSTYGSSSRNSLTGSFIIGPDIEIRGEWGTISGFSTSHTVVNQGTISADVSGANFALGGTGSFVNQGQIQASTGTSIKLSGFSNVGTITAVAGSTLSLGDSVDLPWSNSGTITANGAALNLGGTFDAAAMGSLATTGATISLTGTYTGDLDLNATTGSWRLAGGTLKNGTLTESGGARLIFASSGGSFDGVTLPGGLDLTQDNGAKLAIKNALSVGGPILIGNAAGTTSATLTFGAGSALPANLEIIFGGSASNAVLNAIAGSSAGTLTIPASVTIRGKSGKVDNFASAGTLINQGTISADVAGGKIIVGGTGSFQNQGTLTAQNGGTLALGGMWTNTSTIDVLAASTVELGGTIDTTALVNNVGGTVKLTGTWNGNLSLDGSTGSWQLAGGTLKNGALTESGGARLMFTSAGGTFDGVTLAGGLDLSQDSGAKLTIKNALTLGGPISIGNAAGTTSAILQFATGTSAPSVPAGTVIEFGGSAGNTLVNLASGSGAAGTLTIPASVTLRGKSGMLFNNSSSGTILLQGLLDVDVASGTWYLGTGGNFVNQGTIQSVQSTLRIEGAWNNGLGSFSAPSADVKLVGTLVGNLTLDGSNGAWTMLGGTLKNSTLTQVGLNSMGFSAAGSFDNVALTGVLDLRQFLGAGLAIKNAFSTDSPIYLGNAAGTTYAELTFGAGSAPYSLPAGLEIVLGGATSNKIINGLSGSGVNGTLTIPAGVHIHGKSGSINPMTSGRTIVNQGTIAADVAGGRIVVGDSGTFLNQGSLTAENGATLALLANWSSTGTINNSASTLELGGTIGAVAALSSTGTVNLTGVWTGNLALDATTGSWQLQGGTVLNGTLTETGGSRLIFTANGGIFDGVTLPGPLDLTQDNGAKLTIKNNLVVGGSILVGNALGTSSARLTFGNTTGPYAVPENLDIVFGGSVSNAIVSGVLGSGANGTLTIPASVTIHGRSGTIENTGAKTIINLGTIAADVTGGTVAFGTLGSFTNSGTVRALNGGTLNARFTSPNTGIIDAGAGSTVNLSGPYNQAATGTTRIEVAGTAPSQYGKVNVTGAATLAGLLQIIYAGGFSPANNDAFDVLSYASRTGAYDSIDGSGITFTPAYGPTSLTLTAVVP